MGRTTRPRQSSHPDSRLHNDERTAKRVSDALGTATELRAMKNYAGHRISPWLGHLMVSRQETSRPLLTPGEVMQLSSKEAIVMVSGLHPLRATKVRYHEDPQFQKRIFKPLKQQQFSCPRARILVGAPTPCALDRTACHSAAKAWRPERAAPARARIAAARGDRQGTARGT